MVGIINIIKAAIFSYTTSSQWWTNCCALMVYCARSFAVQGPPNSNREHRGHMLLNHVGNPICSLKRPIPVRSRFRHFHFAQFISWWEAFGSRDVHCGDVLMVCKLFLPHCETGFIWCCVDSRHFHFAQLLSPGGRLSAAGMCIVVMCDGQQAFHIARRASDGVVSSGVVLVMKFLRDLSRLGEGTWPCRGCLSSVACLDRSVMLATTLLMYGLAMPARMCRLLMLVGFRHPVMHLQLSLRTGFSFLAWVDHSHAGHAYSAVEKQRARAVAHSVLGACTPSGIGEFTHDVIACTHFCLSRLNMCLEGKASVKCDSEADRVFGVCQWYSRPGDIKLTFDFLTSQMKSTYLSL